MKESLRRLNADWESRGLKTFHMGIGINFGEVIFGNIGFVPENGAHGDQRRRQQYGFAHRGIDEGLRPRLVIGEAVADLVKYSFRLPVYR